MITFPPACINATIAAKSAFDKAPPPVRLQLTKLDAALSITVSNAPKFSGRSTAKRLVYVNPPGVGMNPPKIMVGPPIIATSELESVPAIDCEDPVESINPFVSEGSAAAYGIPAIGRLAINAIMIVVESIENVFSVFIIVLKRKSIKKT